MINVPLAIVTILLYVLVRGGDRLRERPVYGRALTLGLRDRGELTGSYP